MGNLAKLARPYGGDLLTGEALPPPNAAHRVRYVVPRTSDGKEIPLALHRREMGTDDAFAWSRPFAAFLSDIIPAGIMAEWHEWKDWYTNPYVLERCIARFGEEDTRLAIAYFRGEATRGGIAKQQRAKRRVMRAVRGANGYLPNHDKPICGRHHYRYAE